uniref:ARAD1D06534p n=1 Tax=Blastobotrys adeninivorans TaxID=409370 RepID=A0A060T8X9_BLAAD
MFRIPRPKAPAVIVPRRGPVKIPRKKREGTKASSSFIRLPDLSRRERRKQINEWATVDLDKERAGLFSMINNLPKFSSASSKSPKSLQKPSFQGAIDMIQQYMESTGVRTDPRASQDAVLWTAVSRLKRIDHSGESPPFGVLVQLWELAKVQPIDKRAERVKLVGDIIYSFERARLDPINEADYLFSLFSLGRKWKALALWHSRKTPDIEGMRYWQEVGAILSLQRYDYRSAQEIIEAMEQTFNYVPPHLTLQYLETFATARIPSERGKVERWYDFLIAPIVNNNYQLGPEEEVSMGRHISGQDAISRAESCPVTNESQLKEAIEILIKNKLWSTAKRVIEDLSSLGFVPVPKIIEDLDRATRLKQLKTKKRGRRYRYSPVTYNDSKSFVPLLTAIISAYPNVLNSSGLYHSWYRGLVNSGLYQDAIQVIEAMSAQSVPVEDGDIVILFEALLTKGQVSTALEFLSRLESGQFAGHKCSSDIYWPFIQYACRNGMDDLLDSVLPQLDRYSQKVFSTLLTYYSDSHQLDKLRVLYNKAMEGAVVAELPILRVMWFVLRKLFQNDPEQAVKVADPSLLFRLTISSGPSSGVSLFIYETAMHTMMLNKQYASVCAVLKYLESEKNIQIPSAVVLGLLNLANKMEVGTRPVFPKHRQDIVLKSGHKEKNSESFSWNDFADELCSLVQLERQKLLEDAEAISTDFASIAPSDF